MGKRNYAAVPYEYLKTMQKLSDAEFGRLIRALLNYSMHGTAPTLDGREDMFWDTVQMKEEQFQTSFEKADAGKAEKAKKAAAARWAEQEHAQACSDMLMHAQACSSMHKHANACLECHNDNNNDNNKDNNKEKVSTFSNEKVSPSHDGRGKDAQAVIDAWNSLGLNPIRGVAANSTRKQLLSGRLNQDGLPAILEAIENVRGSAFLNGQNDRGFSATFDWFLKPSNFHKVLDGNYNAKRKPTATSTADRLSQMIEDGVFG